MYVWDQVGRRYLDMMSACSAVSLGHAHPRILRALEKQAGRLGVEADRAEIIVCQQNFHGRTIAIVGMTSEAQYRRGFGPFAPGFKLIAFGDSEALERAITPDTAAFLVEPLQGEGGIILPPAGYLGECDRICRQRNVLLICDEIQMGLGRTGRFLASDHDGVRPDGLILGKALGGGVLPVSLFLARREVMDVFQPGDHGSTFGGNPLACAVGREALNVLVDEQLAKRSAVLGDHLLRRLQAIDSPLIHQVRGKGLFVGVEVRMDLTCARVVCERSLRHGILSKDTHESVVRFAPPLVITRDQIDWAANRLADVLDETGRAHAA